MASNIYKVIGNQFHIDANHVESHINILWISKQEGFEFATNKASPLFVKGGVRTDFIAILGFEPSHNSKMCGGFWNPMKMAEETRNPKMAV